MTTDIRPSPNRTATGSLARPAALCLALCAALLLAGHGSEAAVMQPAAQAGDLQAAETQDARRDAVIRRQVLIALAALRGVDHRKVAVSVSRGIVTLRGTVLTLKDRARAEESAKAVAGVRLVINQLEIAGPDIEKSAY